MDCAFANLDAAGFLEIWQHFDADGENFKIISILLSNYVYLLLLKCLLIYIVIHF